ncbi:MAG TPA: alpha/beta hydrolase-fold protein [Polyangiaceae bacterium]|nr:alpha/beta hydrolase-fold protein [Polyangiaceae bacterium]
MIDDFGPDVKFVDNALTHLFARYAIDERHMAISGFSDGASYALTLGLSNGDLFTHILAFSPGFTNPPATCGRPDIYISHGAQDNVLPIGRCSRRIVPALKNAGYPVRYHEFDGPHAVPGTDRGRSHAVVRRCTRGLTSARMGRAAEVDDAAPASKA